MSKEKQNEVLREAVRYASTLITPPTPYTPKRGEITHSRKVKVEVSPEYREEVRDLILSWKTSTIDERPMFDKDSSKMVLTRFYLSISEREALALADHPGVVSVLIAGRGK